jgi:hypothetical protein
MTLPAHQAPLIAESPTSDRTRRTAPGERRPSATEQEPAIFEATAVADLLSFVRSSMRRHLGLMTAIFVGVVALGGLAAVLLPRHYVIGTKMLADKNVVMPALVERRSGASENDAPTRLATEAVLNRENLVGIVGETKLLAEWPVIRSPLGKARDAVVAAIRGPVHDSVRVNALVDLLRGRMTVETSEGTVTIQLDWMDGPSGYRIVQAAQQHFFDQRRASEVAMIKESITILEGHVATAQQAIQDVLASVPRSSPRERIALPVPRRSSSRPPSQSAEVAMLTAALEAKTQTIAELEATRNERMSALQGRLAELQRNYGSAHPEIVALQENIRALAPESPRLRDLRNEERALNARLSALGPATSGSADSAAPSSAVTQAAVEGLLRARAQDNEPPEQMYAKSRLKIAIGVYEDLLERLEGARLGLETASAGFKYRYTIITPPELPKRPRKPNVPFLLIGSIVLAAGLAVFSAVALDLLRGKILQPWQVSRQLGLPVLAEVRG